MNRTVAILTVGVVAVAAVSCAGMLYSSHQHEEAIKRVASVVDAQPPFGIPGATLTYGAISVSSGGASIPDFKLTLRNHLMISAPMVNVDPSYHISAADVSMKLPDKPSPLTAASFSATGEPGSDSLKAVKISGITGSEAQDKVAFTLESLAFDQLSRTLMTNMVATNFHFDKTDAQHSAFDAKTITLDRLAAGTNESVLGARRLAINGLTSPSAEAKGVTVASLVLEGLPATGDVTSITFRQDGLSAPANPALGGIVTTNGQQSVSISKTAGGATVDLSSTGMPLPDITGKAVFTGNFPPSLVAAPPAWIGARPAFVSGVLDLQDKSGQFKTLLGALKTNPAAGGMDPSVLLMFAASLAHVPAASLEPVGDWLKAPGQKMEVKFSPDPVHPNGMPTFVVTVDPPK